MAAIAPLPRGISAWTYDYHQARVDQILAHNAAAPEGWKFRYLFPYAGSVEPRKDGTFALSYSAEVTAKYAAALPADIRMLPIFDGRQDEHQMDGWSATQYEALARAVADKLLADPHAAGVQVDIEPFRPSHIPFYAALGRLLREQGKLTTGFIGLDWPEPVVRRMYAACDILVLSGYDLEQPDPKAYGAALARALDRHHRIALEVGGRTMVGVPAGGSWAEHEYTGIVEDGVCRRKDTGFTQPQWLGAALDAVAPHAADEDHVGLSLWVLSNRTRNEPGECLPSYQPDFIRDECWALLKRR